MAESEETSLSVPSSTMSSAAITPTMVATHLGGSSYSTDNHNHTSSTSSNNNNAHTTGTILGGAFAAPTTSTPGGHGINEGSGSAAAAAVGTELSDEQIRQKLSLIELLTKRREDVVAQLNDLGSYTNLSNNSVGHHHGRTFSSGEDIPLSPGSTAGLPSTATVRPPHKRNNIFATILGGMGMHLLTGLKDGSFTVHDTDYNKCTPLHIAAYEGRRDMVNLLIQFGADIEALDSEGRTAMDLAQRNRSTGSIIRQDLMAAKHRAHQNATVVAAHQHQEDDSEAGFSTRTGEGDSCSSAGGGGVGSPNGSDHPHGGIGHYYGSAAQLREQAHHINSQDDLSLIGGVSGSTPKIMYSRPAVETCSVQDLQACCDPDAPGNHSATADAAVVKEQQASGAGSSSSTHPTFPIRKQAPASKYTTISDSKSVVVMMVGLPGRGKSFISTRVRRYMNWHGIPCEVFNAGDYRRDNAGAENTRGADYYDSSNTEAAKQREIFAELAATDLCRFLHGETECGRVAVGILDATNTTIERRQKMTHFFSKEVPESRILFVESVCDDEDMINENIIRAKCDNKDWTGMSPETVIKDFRKRIVKYAEVYEPLDHTKEDVSFIKICNVKEHCILHKVDGGIPTRLTYFLLNLHPVAFPVYMTMPGQTEWQQQQRFGGVDSLTLKGSQYADKLADFVRDRVAGDVPMTVLYATDASCIDTVTQIQERIFPEKNVLDSSLPGSPSATSSGGTYRPAGGGIGRSVHRDEVGSSFQDLTAIEGVTVAGGDHHNNNNSMSHNSGMGGEEAEHRVRFAAMRSLDGIHFGTFRDKTVGEACHYHPKIFAKLFGEDNAAAAHAAYEAQVVASRSVDQQHQQSVTDFLNSSSGGFVSTPVPIGGVQFGASHQSSTFGLSPTHPILAVGTGGGGHSMASGCSIPAGGGATTATTATTAGRSPSPDLPPPAPTPLDHEDLVPQYHMSYPRGESTRQVIGRLERALLELMRLDGPVMVIAPKHTIQGLRCFFAGQPPETSGSISTVIQTVYEQGTKAAVEHTFEVAEDLKVRTQARYPAQVDMFGRPVLVVAPAATLGHSTNAMCTQEEVEI